MQRSLVRILALVTLSSVLAEEAPAPRRPVIPDTDFGSSIDDADDADDAFALSVLVASRRCFLLPAGTALLVGELLLHKPAETSGAALELRSLDARCLPEGERAGASRMLDRWLDGLFVEAARRENAAWKKVGSRQEWTAFRDQRLEALRRSLGSTPRPGEPPAVHVTRRLEGDGYRIENIVFASRPGLAVAANLYLPLDRDRRDLPGIVIVHSHHRPKTQGELQDMGMTWARAGCAVLVPELIGHGERRDHPFADEKDWPGSFRAARQDYYFRENLGLQLQLVGESLMGWIVQDLVRSVDVLAARADVDSRRLILIGAVAGGGDPAGVTAALDSRIAAVVPFNFGGPQPDYAIPPDTDEDFYWFGVPYWESTRALRLGARDGFAQWLIVASVAPRRLVYAHEFSWDRDRDPAWPRIERVFSLYGKTDHLGWATGRGNLRGRPPESTHCTNVGRVHREGLRPWLERWFGITASEYSENRSEDELKSITPAVARELGASPVYRLAGERGRRELATLRARLSSLAAPARREVLRERWRAILGEPDGPIEADVDVVQSSRSDTGGLRIERVTLRSEGEVLVPLLLLSRSDRDAEGTAPAVLAISRRGKQGILEERDAGLRELVDAGATVCLADVRGTGETNPGGSGTTASCRALVAGRTLTGARLRDLRSVLAYLRGRRAPRPAPLALWGPSLAPASERSSDVRTPRRVDSPPREGDPVPALLALLAALFEDDVSAVCVEGEIASWLSALETPFLHLPHDSVVPGALGAGDAADLFAALQPRPLRAHGFIDALNRPLTEAELRSAFAPAITAEEGGEPRLDLSAGPDGDRGRSAARWMLKELRGRARR